MDVKSFIKIGLFSVGIPAMNIGSAFAWECSLGHEHDPDEMCTETGDRPCNACEKGFHRGWELCPKTVFEIPSENCKLILVPSNVQNVAVASLLIGCKYDRTSGKEIGHIDLFSSEKDADEVRRLSNYVQRLKNKYLPKKAKGKKEGKFLGKKRNAPEAEAKGKKEGDESAEGIGDDNKNCKVLKKISRQQKKKKNQEHDYQVIRQMEFGGHIKSEQSESEQEMEKKINRNKIISDEEDEGAIKQKKSKKKK